MFRLLEDVKGSEKGNLAVWKGNPSDEKKSAIRSDAVSLTDYSEIETGVDRAFFSVNFLLIRQNANTIGKNGIYSVTGKIFVNGNWLLNQQRTKPMSESLKQHAFAYLT
jgi:hypothetical protein